jgi:peptidoglycan/LPS O-acetylase OafA/YrhL
VSTLGTRFDPRRNGLDGLRLVFAAGVAVTHGMAIHAAESPLFGNTDAGDLALDAFFVLSGFLVTRSFLRLDSPGRFLWHRFLRIVPGFWVCLLVTAFVAAPVAALLRGLPPGTPFEVAPTAWHFVASNAALLMTEYDISGLLVGTSAAEGRSFNGALWTLFFEAACYGIVLLGGVTGILRHRRSAVLAAGVALAVLEALQQAGVDVWLNDRVLRLGFVFVLGMVAHLYRDRIPMHAGLVLPAFAVLVVSLVALPGYRATGAPALAYLVFWFGTWPPIARPLRHDLSYGLYIYHFPTLHLLNLTALAALPTALFVPVGIVAALPVAAASWFLVERRALALKDIRPRRRAADGADPPGGSRVAA